MLGTRKIMVFVLAFVSIQFIAGCAMFRDKDKESLPPDRSSRILVFPVDELEFKNLSCTQLSEKMTLSGQVKNVSLSPVGNVRIRATVLFTGEFPGDYTSETFDLPVNPPVLQPSEWGSFSLTGTVHKPISHAELHAHWEVLFPY
jgi:hypothetical protein